MGPEYRLIRSRRKTISVEITEDAAVIVRAPKWSPLYEINSFVDKNRDWIDKHLKKALDRRDRAEAAPPMDKNEWEMLRLDAMATIPVKVWRYAILLGVDYGRVTIGNQKTLWGSCSAKGNLSFNRLLMKMPENIQDYVVVHELCHRLEMNHSKAFWEHVAKVIPDYKKCRKYLREEGALIMQSARNMQ